jgi:hypothetical protein
MQRKQDHHDQGDKTAGHGRAGEGQRETLEGCQSKQEDVDAVHQQVSYMEGAWLQACDMVVEPKRERRHWPPALVALQSRGASEGRETSLRHHSLIVID